MALILAAVPYGLGRHYDTLDVDRAVYCIKLMRMCLFPLLFSTIFLKISISLLLMRLLYVLSQSNSTAHKLRMRLVLQPRCGRYSSGASLPSIRSRAFLMPLSSSLNVIRSRGHGTNEWMEPVGLVRQSMGRPLRKEVRNPLIFLWITG